MYMQLNVFVATDISLLDAKLMAFYLFADISGYLKRNVKKSLVVSVCVPVVSLQPNKKYSLQ